MSVEEFEKWYNEATHEVAPIFVGQKLFDEYEKLLKDAAAEWLIEIAKKQK